MPPASGRKRSFRSLLFLLAILGPGFVTASAGNDVGGIATYSIAGAKFGYSLLWVLVPLAVALVVVQEMATRMGAVTGKGLASLIRENFGVRISFFAMAGLFFVNLAITASEFAGIATAIIPLVECIGGFRPLLVVVDQTIVDRIGTKLCA